MRALAFAATALLSIPALAQTCDPPFDAYPPIDSAVSMDEELKELWCPKGKWGQQHYDALGLGKAWKWPEQMAIDGHPTTCEAGGTSVRLMNASEALLQVRTSITAVKDIEFYKNNLVLQDHHSMTMNLSRFGYENWGCFVGDPKKGNLTVAANPSNDDPVRLYYIFFFQRDAYSRSTTLVHEAIHEHVGHVSAEDATCGLNPSCDTAYGVYNAQTVHIQALLNAIGSYRRKTTSLSDTSLQVANYGKGECGFVPLLSPLTRRAAADLVENKYMNAFEGAPKSYPTFMWYSTASTYGTGGYGGFQYIADMAARWSCQAPCAVQDYQAGGAFYCDEQQTMKNVAVNQANRQACQAALAQVAAGVTPDELAMLSSKLASGRKPCVKDFDPLYVRAFCDDTIQALPAGMATAQKLDELWTLPDYPGSFDSQAALDSCVSLFCQLKDFTAARGAARAACYASPSGDDVWGCQKYFCGDLDALAAQWGPKSFQVYQAVKCRRAFLEEGQNGRPPAEAMTSNACELLYRECRDQAGYEAWKNAPTCQLVPTPADTFTHQPYDFKALAAMSASADSNRWKTQLGFVTGTGDSYARGLLDACAVERFTCKQAEETTGNVLASLARVKVDPGPLQQPGFGRLSLPELGRNALSTFDRAVTGTGADALRARSDVMNRGETLHVLRRLLGPDVFFSVYGPGGPTSFFKASERATLGARSVDLSAFGDVGALAARVGRVHRSVGGAQGRAGVTARLQTMSVEQRFGALKAIEASSDFSGLESVLRTQLSVLP